MHRGKHGHGRVHAGKAVGTGIETLHKGEEAFGISALPVGFTPVLRCCHGKKEEEEVKFVFAVVPDSVLL